MQGFILAAGEGTRLRPLTLDRPKPMLPVAGRPVLEWIVCWLREAGVTDLIANVHYKPEVVVSHFGEGTDFGVHIYFSFEEKILGTAGGLKRVEDRLHGPVVVVYGDVLTDMDLAPLLKSHVAHDPQPHVTLTLCHVDNPTQCGIVGVDEDGRVTRFQEKPAPEEVFSDLANAGVLVIDHSLMEHVPEDSFYDFSFDLFPKLLASGVPFYGYELPAHTYLLDIGSHESYARAQVEWPTPTAEAWLEG